MCPILRRPEIRLAANQIPLRGAENNVTARDSLNHRDEVTGIRKMLDDVGSHHQVGAHPWLRHLCPVEPSPLGIGRSQQIVSGRYLDPYRLELSQQAHELEAGSAADIDHRCEALALHQFRGIDIDLALPLVAEARVVVMLVLETRAVPRLDAVIAALAHAATITLRKGNRYHASDWGRSCPGLQTGGRAPAAAAPGGRIQTHPRSPRPARDLVASPGAIAPLERWASGPPPIGPRATWAAGFSPLA